MIGRSGKNRFGMEKNMVKILNKMLEIPIIQGGMGSEFHLEIWLEMVRCAAEWALSAL